jgi:DNA gyrase inhibitor GyrI
MRWFNTKDLRSTISAIFTVSTEPPPTAAEQAEKLDVIRRKMLALAVLSKGERSEALARRIRYAATVESLWYARGELMGQLARIGGESAAREKVDALNGLFTELLPKGLRSRPSPLNGSYRSSRPAED